MKNKLFSELRWQSTDLVWRGTYVWRVVSSYVTINYWHEGTNICMKSMFFYVLTPWLDSTYCCHMERRNEESTLQWTQVTINCLGVETNICMKSLIFLCDNQLTWRGRNICMKSMLFYALTQGLESTYCCHLERRNEESTLQWTQVTINWLGEEMNICMKNCIFLCNNQLAWWIKEHMYEESALICPNSMTWFYILLSPGTEKRRSISSVNSGDNQLTWCWEEHMYEESYLLMWQSTDFKRKWT